MSSTEKTLTVAQLIAELKGMPSDALVYTEGCDCTGDAAAVEYELDGTVLIARARPLTEAEKEEQAQLELLRRIEAAKRRKARLQAQGITEEMFP